MDGRKLRQREREREREKKKKKKKKKKRARESVKEVGKCIALVFKINGKVKLYSFFERDRRGQSQARTRQDVSTEASRLEMQSRHVCSSQLGISLLADVDYCRHQVPYPVLLG